MVISNAALMWCAVGTVGITLGAFAGLFAAALQEGADRYDAVRGREASRQFADLFLFIPPERLARLGRCAGLFAFFIFFTPLFSLDNPVSTLSGLILGLVAGAFAYTLPARCVKIFRARRQAQFNLQLVDALGTMSNALRAGFSLTQAFESVVETGLNPIAQEFTVFLQQLRVGMSFDDALASLDARVGSDDLTLTCTAIDIARRTGGNLTEIFDRIAQTVTARLRIERRVRTLTAQGRLQGLVVSLMPLVLGVALYVLKPAVMRPFVFSMTGAIALGLAATCVTCGWLFIRRIICIDV